MNKKEFKMLSFADKIKYFNGKLGEGQTVTRIREDIGIGEKGWQKEVKKNGYKYDTKSKIYVEIQNYILGNFDILKEIIEKYKTTTTSTTNKIIINLVDDKHLNPKPKSIRINEFIYQDWQRFCEENKLYRKQELISMALKEYMENHSNKMI